MSSSSSILFFVNGKRQTVYDGDFDPKTSLLQYIRSIGLTGSKLGCGEGGCGACTVMLSHYNRTLNRVEHLSCNACLTPVCTLNGYAVTTVEGIGGMSQGLHPVQKRVAELHGSQCGFCTPGIVMALYTQLRNKPDSTPHELEEALDGNLCRCTGYRPILDAARSLSNNKGGCCGGNGGSGGCPCKEAEEKNDACEERVHNTSEKCCKSHPSVNEELTSRGITEPIFPPALMNFEYVDTQLTGEGVSWYQPVTLERLLKLKEDMQEKGPRLVVGNSEVGIEMRFKNAQYPVLINPSHVPELQVTRIEDDGVVIGSAVSINRLQSFLLQTESHFSSVNASYKARGYRAIADMLTWFASNHIRNMASIGGNLCTASPISDLIPMLQATGAWVRIASASGGVRKVSLNEGFFLGYRKTAVGPADVLLDVFIPVTSGLEFVLPFKQARRREDDISIVTAGMRVALLAPEGEVEGEVLASHYTIDNITMSFGGLDIYAKIAKKTCEFLAGKKFSLETLSEAFSVLASEVELDVNVPGGQRAYRMSLALSFLRKFHLAVSLELDGGASVAPELKSGAQNFVTAEKPESRGEQIYSIRKGGMQSSQPVPHTPVGDDKTDRGVVGKALMHKSAASQVCGDAKYTIDNPLPSSAAHIYYVTSRVAHGRILSIDPTPAQKVPGFIRYIGAEHIPGINRIGAIVHDELLLADGEVNYYGALIGLVVCETHEAAREAARLVHVEYEILPSAVTIEEAREVGSFYPDNHVIISGDMEKERGGADYVVKGTLRMGAQEHFYLETNNAQAAPTDNGFIDVLSSTQNCAETQKFCAWVCGVPLSKVAVKCKRLGGGFGGKESRAAFVAATAALAAKLCDRPISVNIERDLDMTISGQRHAFVVEYEAGMQKDGRLAFLKADLYSNGGHSLDLSQSVMDRALFHSDNGYHWPAVHVSGKVCRTNQQSHTAYRGFGGPQGMLVADTAIQHLAEVAKMDPDFIRKQNLYTEAHHTHYGQPLEDMYLPRLWSDLEKTADISARKNAITEFNQQNRYKKRGLSVLPAKFGINFTSKFLNQGGALVHIYTDGSVLVAHGGTEMGQGLYTKVIQVAAQTFGIPDSLVVTSDTSTTTVANGSPTAASLSTDLYGMAVLDACEQLVRRLEPIRATLPPTATWAEIVKTAYFQRVDLSAHGFYVVPGDRCGYDWTQDPSVARGHPFNYFTQGVAVSEVEIDTLTGDSRVLRADVLMDVGKSINPAIDIGQIEGAYMQGMGWTTLEEVIYADSQHKWVQPTGRIFTSGPGFYKIPAFNDVPLDMRVHLSDTDNRFAVHSSKAVGEPPFYLGASAFFAIKSAILAAREDNNCKDIYYPLDSPATSERIRMAVGDEIAERCVEPSVTANLYIPKGTF